MALRQLTCLAVNHSILYRVTKTTPLIIRRVSATIPFPPPITEIFEKWCIENERVYSSEEEKQMRLKTFQQAYDYVSRHTNPSDYPIRMNGLADVTDEEFDSNYFGGDEDLDDDIYDGAYAQYRKELYKLYEKELEDNKKKGVAGFSGAPESDSRH